MRDSFAGGSAINKCQTFVRPPRHLVVSFSPRGQGVPPAKVGD